MRLAWFTPWPPQQTGVSGRSKELVPVLAGRGHAIDVFVDEQRVPAEDADAAPPAEGRSRVLSAHDFVWRRTRHPYDAVVYQVGNSRHHQFLWPYLFQYPGLSVLHDTRIHHARGHALLSRGRVDAYRAEFSWSHPATSAAAAELGVHGYSGDFYAAWPMVRGVVAASKVVAAHSPGAAQALEAAWPGSAIHHIALGEGSANLPLASEREAGRRALGLGTGAMAFGIFGALTADKRIPETVRAFAAALPRLPNARLVLGGAPDPALELDRLIAEAGLASHASILPPLDDAGFDQAIAAVDAVISLRWPTAGETSGPWVRALSAGRPTIVMELAEHGGLPTLDPRSMQPHVPFGGPDAPDPIALSIDILDEEHSLTLAMLRLGEDVDLRASLGRAARQWWERHHTIGRMADDYEDVLDLTRRTPEPDEWLPSHLRPDPWRHARTLMDAVGPMSSDRLSWR